jgi:hypothetical protein
MQQIRSIRRRPLGGDEQPYERLARQEALRGLRSSRP